jgi:hypothetical protein
MEHRNKKGPSDRRGGGGLDNVSLEVEMGLEELLAEYVQDVHESIVVGVDA